MIKLHIAYDDVYLDWKLGSADSTHPTNPVRAKYATEMLQQDYDVKIVKPNASSIDRSRLESIHDPVYVSKVLDAGHCGEWRPDNKHLGQVALEMFAGTTRLVEGMVVGDIKVGFNPQGAKHHAQYNHSSGFCVFNDMAWAAKTFNAQGMRVMYIDWDAHHGDGVENLLASERDIVTCSIHDSVIFPGTGLDGHKPDFGIYNWALDPGAGDVEFLAAVEQIAELSDTIKPDVVLLATGADAHITDPLSTLNFDYPGYVNAAHIVGQIATAHTQGRILIGGAGGYQPFDHTPQIWKEVVGTIYDEVRLFSWA